MNFSHRLTGVCLAALILISTCTLAYPFTNERLPDGVYPGSDMQGAAVKDDAGPWDLLLVSSDPADIPAYKRAVIGIDQFTCVPVAMGVDLPDYIHRSRYPANLGSFRERMQKSGRR